VILTLSIMAPHLGSYERPPEYPIRLVVKAIVENPAWADKRIIVAPDLEGPMIAEFAMQDQHRPSYELLRPNKLFAKQDWFGEQYVPRFQSPDEMMAYLRQNPVDLIVWRVQSGTPLRAHVRYMEEMLRDYPLAWQKVVSFGSASGALSSWMVYKFVPR